MHIIMKIGAASATAIEYDILEGDRAKIREEFEEAKIDYTAKEYDANHAYFQRRRPSCNQLASERSWTDLEQFIGVK